MGLKVVFMGTPEFAVPALRGLIAGKHPVIAVYSQPPRPAGRGQKLTPSPVHRLAEENHAPVFTPLHFKSPETVETLRGLGADIGVVAAYGLLLPKSVLKAFPHGCINIHPSALPRWRGAAPIHRTVLAGDAHTDICIMQMDEGLDTGAVLARQSYSLPQDITTGALHTMLAENSVSLLLSTLDAIAEGKAHAVAQPEIGVTYAKKISKEEGRIDWTQSAESIDRHIRGLNPYPAASTFLNGEPIKILAAEYENKSHFNAPGTVIDEAFSIACGQGILRPQQVQRPGKKPMTTQDMLKGYPIPRGTQLE